MARPGDRRFLHDGIVQIGGGDEEQMIHAYGGYGLAGIPPGRHGADDVDPGHQLAAEDPGGGISVAVLGHDDLDAHGFFLHDFFLPAVFSKLQAPKGDGRIVSQGGKE